MKEAVKKYQPIFSSTVNIKSGRRTSKSEQGATNSDEDGQRKYYRRDQFLKTGLGK